MASCDDDFSLLADDNQTPHHSHHHLHHHHQTYNSHPFTSKSTPINSQLQPPPPTQQLSTSINIIGGVENPNKSGADEEDRDDDDYSNVGFNSSKCTSTSFNDVNVFGEDDSNPFATPDQSDPNKSRANSRSEKRKEQEELTDDGTTTYSYKKSKPTSSTNTTTITITTSSSGMDYRYKGEYRKDREEWSENAIGILLDAYMDKFVQLNRGNLRGRDWEEVAAIVSERSDKQKAGKSVEQCKNKVDNLKKRYKVEMNRMNSSGLTVSHWPWFKKIEQILVNSPSSKTNSAGDNNSPIAPASITRQQQKRYAVIAPRPVPMAITMNSKPSSIPRWRRVVFKISGAALAGTGNQSIDPKVPSLIAREVAAACRLGVEVAIIVGGRNFFCGDSWVAATGQDRTTAYHIGMMSTVMNSILLQSSLEKQGIQTRVQTSFPMELAESYCKRRAIRHLEKGRVVIFGGVGAGSGSPLFTTDTAAALRAPEIGAEAVLKGTNFDGVYDHQSRNNSMGFEHISYRELVSRGANSMDAMAITFCEDNGIPIVIFNLLEPGNISRALCGNQVGTLIDQSARMS